ncbi:MAG TPA: 4'-phosphopantetheinyl transferase superfamily protein [Terriglobales bacterium]|nr:4'-phosphopantetheinyl transferase superfamily protein [Terriglobales bacterium]
MPLSLQHDSVDIWTVALNATAPTGDELQEILSADEQARAARFHFEPDQRRYIVTRAHLRRLVSGYTTCPAERIRFRYSARGKPALEQPAGDLRINVSHSDEHALLAFTRGREIGVDIEKMKPEIEALTLAVRFFSPGESETLKCLPEDKRGSAFYRGWTCKEALLKAWGTGLYLPLDCFDVEIDPTRPAGLLATRPDASLACRWSVQDLRAPDGYAAALAVEGNISKPKIRTFEIPA